MNPENKSFFNHEEEINENKAENKEKREYVNLSFASASDLVKQIEEKGYFDSNEYQNTCKYGVIYNKNKGKNDVWDFESEEEIDFEDEHLTFYKQLPDYFKEAQDENMQVFFCGSKYDIPLTKISNLIKPLEEINKVSIDRLHHYLTPDGVQYQYIQSSKGGMETIIYSDKKRFPIDEVQKLGKLVEEKQEEFYQREGLKSFVKFDYNFNKQADS